MSLCPVSRHLFLLSSQLKQPVFLRELEYFQGIMFLTTNLGSTIDDAFQSRINMQLLFPPLSYVSRRIIWSKFLSCLPAIGGASKAIVQIDESDLDELAKWELNGRQIKNAMKTVRTWCICKDYAITRARMENGILVTKPDARMEGKVEVVDKGGS